MLTVTNTGSVSAQDLPRLFDRFYQVDSARCSVRSSETGGFGLGLSVAKSIMTALGGEIRASSVEGESTTFTLRLKDR